jgi:hypothetical protein
MIKIFDVNKNTSKTFPLVVFLNYDAILGPKSRSMIKNSNEYGSRSQTLAYPMPDLIPTGIYWNNGTGTLLFHSLLIDCKFFQTWRLFCFITC